MSLSIRSCRSSLSNSHSYIPSTSVEHLLPKTKAHHFSSTARPARPVQIQNKHLLVVRGASTQTQTQQKRRMSSQPVNIQPEQKKSYGIGGAGNIRRPSDVIYPPRLNADGTRRRSSVWSISPGSSPEGKRATLMNLFSGRKASVSEDQGEGENRKKSGE